MQKKFLIGFVLLIFLSTIVYAALDDDWTPNLSDFGSGTGAPAAGAGTGILTVAITEPLNMDEVAFDAEIPFKGTAIISFEDDASTDSVSSWNWTFSTSGVPASTEQNPKVTFAKEGTFEVVLTATIVSGEKGTDTIKVVVKKGVAPPKPEYSSILEGLANISKSLVDDLS